MQDPIPTPQPGAPDFWHAILTPEGRRHHLAALLLLAVGSSATLGLMLGWRMGRRS